MSGLFSWLGKTSSSDAGIPALFTLSLTESIFVRSDILNTYLKILTDTVERTHGLSAEHEVMLWDSCVQSDANQGLLSLLACAMTDMSDLFLVYVPSVKVVRKATGEETQQIRIDYEKTGESSVGVYISFKNYRRTEMLRIYSSFEYCVLASLNKTLNVAKSVQFKINDLRASVSLVDADAAKTQAKAIAEAMRLGNDVMLDAKDIIETATPDTSPTEKAVLFLDAKRAFILGLPMAYITGEQTAGMGGSGENDMRAVERGLKQYFVSVIRPALKALFKTEAVFRSQDFREISSALEVLKTFDLVSNENISPDSKRAIAARVFGLDPDQEGKLIKKNALTAADVLAAGAEGAAPTAEGTDLLNGAQITAVVTLVQAVASGTMPRDAALNTLMVAFKLDKATAEKLLGAKGFAPTKTAEPPKPVPFGAPKK